MPHRAVRLASLPGRAPPRPTQVLRCDNCRRILVRADDVRLVSGTTRVVIEADGGARGNPGPAGYGAVVRDADDGTVLAERSEFIGTATNNVAEYRGLIAGLRAAAELGAAEVAVRMDSKLVVEQMKGAWQVKNAALRVLAREAVELRGRFATVTFQWIPREQNRDADRLANQAMDRELEDRRRRRPPRQARGSGGYRTGRRPRSPAPG